MDESAIPTPSETTQFPKLRRIGLCLQLSHRFDLATKRMQAADSESGNCPLRSGIVAADLVLKNATNTAAAICEAGGEAHPLEVDVSDPSHSEVFVKRFRYLVS